MASSSSSSIPNPAEAQAILQTMYTRLGREVKVFMNRAAIMEDFQSMERTIGQEPDDFYDLTEQDYIRLMGSRKQDTFFKTKKIREAEAMDRRARITKANIRIQFPDNYILEAKFQPSDTIQDLIGFVQKVIAKPDLPFYLYTTPPKLRLNNLRQDLYSAGLTPGALVYFSPMVAAIKKEAFEGEGSLENTDGPYLCPDVMALRDMHLLIPPPEASQQLQVETNVNDSVAQAKPEEPTLPRIKKPGVKPKWMKL